MNLRGWLCVVALCVGALVVGFVLVERDDAATSPDAVSAGGLPTDTTVVDHSGNSVVGIDDVSTVGESTRVVGWVLSEGPTQVEVRSGDTTAVVEANQARHDRNLAYSEGRSHWGFVALLPDPGGREICAAVGDTAACRPVQCRAGLFGARFMKRLAAEYPGKRFTAQVVDTRTDCVYDLEPELRITSASVIKLEVLGDLLLDAQNAGRELTAFERSQAEQMMQFSLNPPTSRLYGHIGGVSSLSAYSASVGAVSTTHTPVYGATWTTAADRTAVALSVLDGQGDLSWAGVETAWDIMGELTRSQRWGISAAVPEDWNVAQKNGFYPFGIYRWRIGSTGFVSDPDGGGYAITIMTDGNPTQAEGVALVEDIAARVASRLTTGAPAERDYDDLDCLTYRGTGSWASLTAQLGLDPAQEAAVRRAAGGDGPLVGQQICTP